MPKAFLTRTVTFAAAHRYRRPEWSEEKNQEVFGLCARESFHGHSYVCDEVKNRFDHRNINLDVPEFADGQLVPSGENLARFIFDRVRVRLPGSVTIDNVKIAEDRTLSATYRGEE
jgi:6-pyruvoyltetrahydropterin/6-carboxytetrahydropterin synthase